MSYVKVNFEGGDSSSSKLKADPLSKDIDYSGSQTRARDEELNMDFKGLGIDEPRAEEKLPEEVLADSGCRMLDGIYRI
eukprot:736676-Alexandrium_andersonii.AAC.1